MPRPKKSVILFVVEGESDKRALERPIQSLLEDNSQGIEATFLVAETDVTSDFRVTPENISEKINRFYFEPFFSSNEYYYPKDVIEVVQLCDLDGTYIPPENCCAFDEKHFSDSGYVYDPPFVYGQSAEDVKDRNRRKAENINALLLLDSIKVKTKTKPYSVYFFSSNIDHYLYDKLNLSGREKLDLADNFADKCDEDPTWFIRRICHHSQALKGMSREETWVYIKDGTNSVRRHTNFNIYLNSLMERIQPDDA